jgi:hypothetical protein
VAGAAFHTGKSKQDYSTPVDLLNAVERKLQLPIVWDLAAHERNRVGDNWLGPGGAVENAFHCNWHDLAFGRRGLLWLNPPFGNIAPWAKKCADEASMLPTWGKIAFLVPASVGSNWFAEYVHGKARVFFLRPRLSFDGKNSFPKDCLLAVYGEKPGYECWNWRQK